MELKFVVPDMAETFGKLSYAGEGEILTEGIVVDSVLTFGKLRFSALRREVRKQNEDGTVSNEVKERTYNLKSSAQGRMIQVSIPANVPLREFAYDAEVELVNPIVDTVANYVFREGTTVNWFIKADDLVLKRQPNQGNSTNQIEGKK